MNMRSIENILIERNIIDRDTFAGMKSDLIEINKTEAITVTLGEELVKCQLLSEQELINIYSMISDGVFIENIQSDKELLCLYPDDVMKKYCFMPLKEAEDFVDILFKEPQNLFSIEKARDYVRPKKVNVYYTFPSLFNKTLANLLGINTTDSAISQMRKDLDFNERDEEHNLIDIDNDSNSDAGTTKFVNEILKIAISENASDIHIEPEETKARTRIRVDGVLRTIKEAPIELHSFIVARIKVMGNMDVTEHRIPLDGRSTISVSGTEVDLRISSLPIAFGEKIVIRLLYKSMENLKKESIGLNQNELSTYEKLLQNHSGVILMVGPTGSGKSTTMVTMIKALNNSDVNIITLEDPVEYNISGVSQVQINNKTNMTFANGLRAAMRQDPDIICIGEIRDGETAEIAMRAAITGHLVISTVHTNNAISTFERLKDIGVAPYLISSAIIGIISQRLVRKICPYCKSAYMPEESLFERLNISNKYKEYTYYKGEGCGRCYNTGYIGRTAVFEILVMNQNIKRAIVEGKSVEEIEKMTDPSSYRKINDSCMQAVLDGVTTLEEMNRIINVIN